MNPWPLRCESGSSQVLPTQIVLATPDRRGGRTKFLRRRLIPTQRCPERTFDGQPGG
jgi:hypothetical protein